MSDQVNTKYENKFAAINQEAATGLSQYANNLMRELATNKSHPGTLVPHNFSNLSNEQLTEMSKNRHPAGLTPSQMCNDGAKLDQGGRASIGYRREIEELLHPKSTQEQAHHPLSGANRLHER